MNRDEKIRKAFGARLRAMREQKGWVQTELAYEAEIEPGYVSRLELGKAGPSLEVIISIAAALGCKPGDLVNDII